MIKFNLNILVMTILSLSMPMSKCQESPSSCIHEKNEEVKQEFYYSTYPLHGAAEVERGDRRTYQGLRGLYPDANNKVNPELVTLVKHYKASNRSLNEYDECGRTPLDRARSSGSLTNAKYLEEQGAECNRTCTVSDKVSKFFVILARRQGWLAGRAE